MITIIVVSLGLIAAPVQITNFPATWFLEGTKFQGVSGYAVVAAPGTVTEVTGKWTVPQVGCRTFAPNAALYISIGVDISQYAEGAGILIHCASTGVEYSPFYSWGGTDLLIDTTSVEPGDVLRVEMLWHLGHFEATFNDYNGNWTIQRDFPETDAPRLSVAWGVFSFWQNGKRAPLPDFGIISFSECYANIEGTMGPIDSFPTSALVKAVMIDESKTVLATPSPPSWPDGSSFSVQLA